MKNKLLFTTLCTVLLTVLCICNVKAQTPAWDVSGSNLITNGATGNVGIGTSSPGQKLVVNGITQSGNNAATDGSVILKAKYDPYPAQTLLTEHSSGGIGLGQYMYQDGSPTWLSSFDYGAIPRSALVVAIDQLKFMTAPSQDTTPGQPLRYQPTTKFIVLGNGNVGINITSPTASLHIAAGSSSNAPLKFTSGTDLSSPVAGAWYYDGARLGFSPSTTIKRVALTNDVAPTNGQIPIGNGTDYTAATITAGFGIAITNSAGGITISNTCCDTTGDTASSLQAVTLAGSTTNVACTFNNKVVINTSCPGGLTVTGGVLVKSGGFTDSSLAGFLISAPAEFDITGKLVRGTSDARLKTNIETIGGNLNKVLALRPVRYNYINTDKYGKGKTIGFIAQELEKIVPEAVGCSPDSFKLRSVNYNQVIPVLTGAIQEQQQIIQEQQKSIAMLKDDLALLQSALAELKATVKTQTSPLNKKLENIGKVKNKSNQGNEHANSISE